MSNSSLRVTLRMNKNSYGKVKHYDVLMNGRVIENQSATSRKMASVLVKNKLSKEKLDSLAGGQQYVVMF